MEDLRAVSYGHAVSSLGYEVKVGKDDLYYRDAERHVDWQCKKQKDNTLFIYSKSISVKRHGAGAHKEAKLDDREAQMIPQIVLKALKVLKIRAEYK